jgi:hypothetical protein
MSASITSNDESDQRELSFQGTVGEDVSLFLRDVKRVARKEGRQRDEEWLVDYVEECLSGPALQWFIHLDDEVARNWKALRMALLNRFAAPGPPIPPPAAVPPSPASVTAPADPGQAVALPSSPTAVGSRMVSYPARESDKGPYMAGDFDLEIQVSNFIDYTLHINLANEQSFLRFVCSDVEVSKPTARPFVYLR